MASWKNDDDIARDLDILSGIQSPTRNIKSYSTWGRGRAVDFQAPEEFENPFQTQDKRLKEEFKWFEEMPVLEKLPDSVGRGKKLEILTENIQYRGKEEEVHEQLRAAMGAGHSNALIEASFKQWQKVDILNDHVKPDQQFEDPEERHSKSCMSEHYLLTDNRSSDFIKFDNGKTERFAPEHTESKVNCSDVLVSKEEKCSRKRKPRRYRNAVLESLQRMDSSGNLPGVNNRTSLQGTVSISERKLSNIPPAGYFPGKSMSGSFLHQEPAGPFAFNESEFPKLQ